MSFIQFSFLFLLREDTFYLLLKTEKDNPVGPSGILAATPNGTPHNLLYKKND